MADIYKPIFTDNGVPIGEQLDWHKFKAWVEQKDRQIEELRTMVEHLAFKDVRNDDQELLYLSVLLLHPLLELVPVKLLSDRYAVICEYWFVNISHCYPPFYRMST